MSRGAGIAPVLAANQPSALDKSTFAAFLDILIPGNSGSGSASDLLVDQGLWQIAGEDEQFHQLVHIGCQWLNMTGGMRFANLSSEQQGVIVTWMAQADWNQVPRRFYELVRQLALELYYSQTAAWAGLPIQSPPQPRGYPPPWP